MNPRVIRSIFAISFGAALFASTQDTSYRPQGQQIPSPSCLLMKAAWEGGSKPCTPKDHGDWLAEIRIGVMNASFALDTTASATTARLQVGTVSFMQPQMMVQDRYFYDPVAGSTRWTAISMTWRSGTGALMPCLSGRLIRIWGSTTGISMT